MKKFLTLICAFVLSLTACAGLFACGGEGDNGDKPTPPAAQTSLNLYETISQSESLVAVKAGEADIALVDAFVAGNYLRTTDYADFAILEVPGISFEKEQFCMLTKKDTNLDDYINAALYEVQENKVDVYLGRGDFDQVDMDLVSLANFFGISNLVLDIPEPTYTLDELNIDDIETSEVGKLKVGYSINPDTKSAFQLESLVAYSHFGCYIGTELYYWRAVAKALDITLDGGDDKYISNIAWGDRARALNNGEVDIIIGAMTPDNADKFDVSVPYIESSFVMVVNKADLSKYTNTDSLKSAKFAADRDGESKILVENYLKTAILG